MEHSLRACLLACGLGAALGLTAAEQTDVYYLALLRRIGCTGDAHELGVIFGDDRAAHARSFLLDFSRPLTVLADVVRFAGSDRLPWLRALAIARAVAAGPGMPAALFRASCEVARNLAEQLGFGPSIREALDQTFERWDGRGFPGRVQGEAILRSARIVQVAEEAEVFARIGGVEGAVAEVGKRSGSAYDPLVAECFRAHADALFAGLEVPSAWQAALAAEPGPPVWLPEEQVDGYLGAIAHFVDLKSPFAAGHSTGVAALAADAAAQMGLPEAEVATVRRAGLLHDVGRASVPNRIWEKPGPLTDAEWEHVRLHPYYAERLLGRSDALASVAALAGLHHERLDGSGYYRGLPATLLSPAARVLAAADTYHAMLEPRPYRAPLAPEGAVDALRREVSAGRLDGAAVAAVLRAAGHRVRRRREWPAGLSSREVEVLRLLARGLSNRAVAHQLVLSEATVAAHIRHVYDKIGVTTRAAATLFAMQHGLLDPTLSTEK